ncbi:hypothetical protein OB960_01310 [Halobacteria archaeon AArc-xg1-1]|uniref:Uncharacterized protein n=1 Tax=Natronoglomus mannanivorans TaxID=2979990 RepID=A0AAP2YVC5_9EURY|nr:hypothetical protein [Halobacteria archaeon AArc-xg1-1]
MIQNARDAIESTSPGQVYVGILDEGILVANTGEPFDLLDEDTERAVKMIGESNKTDQETDEAAGVDMDSESVGHIGVGLKSTVAVGDDFEVWSRRPEDTEPLRVRYSRAYITAAVAARFGNELPAELDLADGLVGAYAEAAENGLFEPHPQFKSNPIDAKDDLGKAPLFWFPWPLDPEAPGPSNSTLADRANQLLTAPQKTLSQFSEPPSAPFRTAVFVEYRDDMWRSLLSEFDIPTPIESPDNPAERADELWEKLSHHGDRSEGFDPETLINLGKIEDLYLERISKDTTIETEHWSVYETEPKNSVPDEGVNHRRFDVDIRTDSKAQTLTYDSYAATWDGVETTRPRVIVERPRVSADGTARSTYPLHLYYPVSATGDALPVCFHGRFRVTTERKDLSRGSADHNRRVLKHGAELFGRIAAGTATLASNPETADHWSRYPWVLLPDSDTDGDRIPESPKDTADLIDKFRQQTVKALRDTPTVPTISGPATVDNTTVYPSSTNFKAIAAATEITEASETAAPTADSLQIPTPETLRAALKLQKQGSNTQQQRQQWEGFVGEDRATGTLKEWARWLNNVLAVDEATPSKKGTPTRVVDVRRGQEMFAGMVELIDKAATELDTSISTVLEKDWLADTLPGVYLLPCEQADSDETVELVPIEPSPSGQIERGARSTRTVLWGLDRGELPFSYPPEHGQFDVFFVDQESQRSQATDVLRKAGKSRTWGVREYTDFPSLYEALLQTFKPSTRDLDLGSLAALSDLVSNIEVDSEALGQSELSVGDRSHFTKSLSNTDRRSSLRLRLGIRRSAIHSPKFPDTALADLSLSDTWQQHRHDALQTAAANPGDEDSNVTEEPAWDLEGEFASSSLPEPTPDTEAWEGFPEIATDAEARLRLARTISLLGVSSLPGVRYLPLHGDTHPRVNEGVPNWEPAEWTDKELPTWAVKHRNSLRDAIAATDYTSFITSYNHHPQNTVSHLGCEKAPTTAEASKQQSYLIGWAWFEPAQLATLESNPNRVRTLLDRYSSEYQQNLLTTKWHCRRYSGCSMTDATVPTVANLQLRQLPIWGPIVKITETFENNGIWGSEHDRLSCAVIETKAGGRSGWRLFPHIDPDDDEVMVSESLLANLGVVPLSDLNVTGAEYRLQRIQAVLADTAEDDLTGVDEPIRLSIPSAQLENWKRAYSLLLRPILDAWDTPDDDGEISSVLDELLSTLTHIPLKRDGEWYTASVEWVRDHGGTAVWRYPRENPTRWVKTALSEAYDGQPGYHFEHPVQQAGFAEFAETALRIPSLSATEPHLSNDLFNERTRPTTEVINRSKLQEWTERLESRLPLLLATISARSHDRLESAIEILQTGINNIAVIDKLPASIRADLSDPRSVTYRLPNEPESTADNDPKGIAVVASEINSPAIGALTQAIALLTKQFGDLGTIQSVLEADEYMQARRRLEGTYPVRDAEQFLEERRRTNLRTRFELAADLLDWLDYPRPSVEGAAKQLQEHSKEETDFEKLGDVIRNDTNLSHVPDELQKYLECCRAVDQPIREALALLFNPGPDGVATVRKHITALEPEDRKQELIEWFAVHSRDLPGNFVPKPTADQCRRLSQADAVWVETDEEFVTSPPDWHGAIEEQGTTLTWHDQLPEYASTEKFGTYWLDLTVNDRVTALIDCFHSQLTSEIPDQTADKVRAYITDGDPLPAPADSSPDHKERAFASATNYLLKHDVSSLAILDNDSANDDVGPDTPDQSLSNGSTGGGPGSFTGRGELAEVAVTLEILTRTVAWLDAESAAEETLVNQFHSLYRTQTADGDEAVDYQWHTERRWTRELRPLLTQDTDRLLTEFTDWQSAIPTDGSLANLASVALLDVSGEQGPGFDLIDPVTQDGTAFSPCPVEVKSVATTDPPYSIRLSTNEYQQCKLHVSQSDHPYVLRIVYVPSDNPTIAASKDVATYEITTVDQLKELVGHPFDMQVRSGYLRPTLDKE